MDQYNLGQKCCTFKYRKRYPCQLTFLFPSIFQLQDLKTNSPYSMPCISYSYACSCKNYTLDHALFLFLITLFPSPPSNFTNFTQNSTRRWVILK